MLNNPTHLCQLHEVFPPTLSLSQCAGACVSVCLCVGVSGREISSAAGDIKCNLTTKEVRRLLPHSSPADGSHDHLHVAIYRLLHLQVSHLSTLCLARLR